MNLNHQEQITISMFCIETKWALDKFKGLWKHRAPALRGEDWRTTFDWWDSFVAWIDESTWNSYDYTNEEHF